MAAPAETNSSAIPSGPLVRLPVYAMDPPDVTEPVGRCSDPPTELVGLVVAVY